MVTVRRQGIAVLILADPGMCFRRAQSAQERLREELERVFGAATIHVRSQFLGISSSNDLEFPTVGSARSDLEDVDVLLLLTEMPRRRYGRPVIAELFHRDSAAALSYPTIGVLASRERLVAMFMACVTRLVDGVAAMDRDRYTPRWHHWDQAADGLDSRLSTHAFTGASRTVLGMVVTNEPWKAAPKLSGALAAAVATGAFGIFYSNIWQMSAALSTQRLLTIGILAITLMTLWLIVGNRLWERPQQDDPTTVLVYYNLSTVLTLLICVLALYLALVILILGASLIVIDPDYMAGVLGEPAKFARYLDIAWLSAALGVVAGGLGATFDAEADLRLLTHGSREDLRRSPRNENNYTPANPHKHARYSNR